MLCWDINKVYLQSICGSRLMFDTDKLVSEYPPLLCYETCLGGLLFSFLGLLDISMMRRNNELQFFEFLDDGRLVPYMANVKVLWSSSKNCGYIVLWLVNWPESIGCKSWWIFSILGKVRQTYYSQLELWAFYFGALLECSRDF